MTRRHRNPGRSTRTLPPDFSQDHGEHHFTNRESHPNGPRRAHGPSDNRKHTPHIGDRSCSNSMPAGYHPGIHRNREPQHPFLTQFYRSLKLQSEHIRMKLEELIATIDELQPDAAAMDWAISPGTVVYMPYSAGEKTQQPWVAAASSGAYSNHPPANFQWGSGIPPDPLPYAQMTRADATAHPLHIRPTDTQAAESSAGLPSNPLSNTTLDWAGAVSPFGSAPNGPAAELNGLHQNPFPCAQGTSTKSNLHFELLPVLNTIASQTESFACAQASGPSDGIYSEPSPTGPTQPKAQGDCSLRGFASLYTQPQDSQASSNLVESMPTPPRTPDGPRVSGRSGSVEE